MSTLKKRFKRTWSNVKVRIPFYYDICWKIDGLREWLWVRKNGLRPIYKFPHDAYLQVAPERKLLWAIFGLCCDCTLHDPPYKLLKSRSGKEEDGMPTSDAKPEEVLHTWYYEESYKGRAEYCPECVEKLRVSTEFGPLVIIDDPNRPYPKENY